jgi:hypothetical protein
MSAVWLKIPPEMSRHIVFVNIQYVPKVTVVFQMIILLE